VLLRVFALRYPMQVQTYKVGAGISDRLQANSDQPSGAPSPGLVFALGSNTESARLGRRLPHPSCISQRVEYETVRRDLFFRP
jgi:hypothetical protein